MRASDDYISLSLPSDPKYLGLLREVVGQAAEIFGFSDSEREELMLAVTEGCTNIIRHCYGMDARQKIDLTIRVLPDRMELELRDYGEFKEVVGPEPPCSGEIRAGGLGIKLMKSIMDEVQYRPAGREGTLLKMVKIRRANDS